MFCMIYVCKYSVYLHVCLSLQDFEAFSEAIEDNALYEFLKLAPPKEVSQASVTVTGVRYKYVTIDYSRSTSKW